jgi:SUKH-4 immunity protein
MITPEHFAEAWQAVGDQLIAFPDRALAGLPLPPEALHFLRAAGLPDQAAPFLIFRTPAAGAVPSATEAFDLSKVFSDCFVIGSTGSGDPIAIVPDGRVVIIDHDRKFSITHLSASVPVLAATLLRYRDLIAKGALEDDGDAALRRDFRAALKGEDPIALEPGSFWFEEIAGWPIDS